MGVDWHLLKPGLASNGYRTVSLGRGKTRCVHRLVAEAFILNPQALRTVNHRDGVKTNDAVENLEWASYSENLRHACRVLGLRCGENHYFARRRRELPV